MNDLMIPRYLVIASYPKSAFALNQIIEMVRKGKPMDSFENDKEVWLTAFIPIGSDKKKYGSTIYSEGYFTPFPHIFKLLQWWECRDVKVFKKLLKTIEYIKTKSGEVRKIDKYHFTGDDVKDWWFVTGPWAVGIEHCEPATPSDYEAYKTL